MVRTGYKKRGVAANPAPERAYRQLVRTLGLLERVMQPYFAQFGISGAQWGVLRNLYRGEQEGARGLRLTDLGRRMLIRPPSVTGIVDRLEKMRLIVRVSSTIDLRAKHVALTDEGRRVVKKVEAVHDRQVARAMGGLALKEQHELFSLLIRLGQHLEGMVESRDYRSAALIHEAS